MGKTTEPTREPDGRPFGTSPRRAAWPLLVWSALFAAWLVFLLWMALRYPAR